MIDKALFSLPGVRGALAVLLALNLVFAFAVVGQAWGLAAAVVGLWEGGTPADQAGWLALFAGCFAARQLLTYVQDAYLERYAAARADELRGDLLRTVFTGGAAVVQAHGTGAVCATVLEGVDQVETYLRLILPKMVAVVAVPVVLLCWLFPIDWVTGLIALLAFPCIIMFMVILGRAAGDEAARRHATFRQMSNHFIDSLRGIDTLKLFGRSKSHGQEVFEVSERFRTATVQTLRVATLSSTVLDLCATGALAAVSIMLGFRLMGGSMTLFPALLSLILVPEYFKPVREFGADYHASLDGKNALVGILELIGEAEGEGQGEDEGESDSSLGHREGPSGGPVAQTVLSSHGQPTGLSGSCGTRLVDPPTPPRSKGTEEPGPSGAPVVQAVPSSHESATDSASSGLLEREGPGGSTKRVPHVEQSSGLFEHRFCAREGATSLAEGEAGSVGCSPKQDCLSDWAPPTPPAVPQEGVDVFVSRAGAIAPWGRESTLELRGVGFSFPDYRALEDVSFAVRGCAKVGIVGLSGAGKSTLVNVLAGFSAPEAGEVLVDGAAVGGLRRPDWQGQVLYIPQSPYLFHATLRENIAFYCPDAGEERIARAVDAVGLGDLVGELPCGLDTLVGEGARALSGGQAQRIALARAFLDDSRRVLLFDEPTAHLDIETELELKERMLPLMEGRLVFFATHRLHWMAQMDLILVMDAGRVVQAGTLPELLGSDGAFSRLVSQMGGDAA